MDVKLIKENGTLLLIILLDGAGKMKNSSEGSGFIFQPLPFPHNSKK
jgi:hypothetical protein